MPTVINTGSMPQENAQPKQDVQVNAPVATATAGQPQTAAPDIVIPSIVDHETPIVVFVGPPASGKSMILVRIAKYLREMGFTIKADRTFINTDKYRAGCDAFENLLDTNIALPGTVEYLLVDVRDSNGNNVAKLLEAPGEHFYDTKNNGINANNTSLQGYLSKIMTSNNPKTYVTLLDLDSDVCFRVNETHRNRYTTRILETFYKNMHPEKDRFILLYNKVDAPGFGTIHGISEAKKKQARKDAELYYATLFNTMKITKLVFFTLDDFAFQTFCTGNYTNVTDDNGNEYKQYDISNNSYPQELWMEIIKKW